MRQAVRSWHTSHKLITLSWGGVRTSRYSIDFDKQITAVCLRDTPMHVYVGHLYISGTDQPRPLNALVRPPPLHQRGGGTSRNTGWSFTNALFYLPSTDASLPPFLYAPAMTLPFLPPPTPARPAIPAAHGPVAGAACDGWLTRWSVRHLTSPITYPLSG